MLAKQAKTLSKRQITLTTALLQQTRYPTRNLAIFLLSVKAGLRAKEIASLTWDMLTDAEGTSRSSAASQGRSQQVFVWQGHPVEQGPQAALQTLQEQRGSSPYVITTERAERTSAAAIVNQFASWYRAAGLQVAPAIQADAPSSPMPHERSPLWEDLCGTFRCWLDTEPSAPPSAT